ncbi:MAG: polyhydroxybutyrate depolymerase [Deltaproteobacteria bacterium]|nr:polyhydroxybutyrate depolymerase [Deltaproteobacteria bacterium]
MSASNRHRRIALIVIALAACAGACRRSGRAPAALSPGDERLEIDHAGLKRSSLVHVPPQARAGKPLPVVLDLHGGGGNAESQKKYSAMDGLADKEGFVVLYPNGYGKLGERLLTWNAGSCCGPAMKDNVDDVGFLLGLVDALSRRLPIDPARVYATGLSNGAMMAYRLAAEAPDRIAAIAPVAGAGYAAPSHSKRAVPVMHIHSVDDPRALYLGGEGPPFPMTNSRVTHEPVEAVLARWVAANGCAPTPVETRSIVGAPGTLDAGQTARRLEWSRCRDGAEVVHWKLTGAGHVWPGGDRHFLEKTLGPGTAIIDANVEMWLFFRGHPLPAPR